jgi:LPXTG-motif cell wall-anchored protein
VKSSRPPFFSGWACVALAVAMLLVPSVAGAEVDDVAASGQNENAADCAQPGPCEDGEPEPPRAPVEESGSGCDEACRSLPTTSEGAAATASRNPVSASEGALGSGRVAERGTGASRGPTASAVANVRLARTGAETWLVGVLGIASAAAGLGWLAVRRRGRAEHR